jgi:hypothetical protein
MGSVLILSWYSQVQADDPMPGDRNIWTAVASLRGRRFVIVHETTESGGHAKTPPQSKYGLAGEFPRRPTQDRTLPPEW